MLIILNVIKMWF